MGYLDFANGASWKGMVESIASAQETEAYAAVVNKLRQNLQETTDHSNGLYNKLVAEQALVGAMILEDELVKSGALKGDQILTNRASKDLRDKIRAEAVRMSQMMQPIDDRKLDKIGEMAEDIMLEQHGKKRK